MEIVVLIIMVVILFLSQFSLDFSGAGSCKRYDNSEEMQILSELKKEIENSSNKIIGNMMVNKDFPLWRSDGKWNFDHFAVPSILINKEKIIIEANTQFYKAFRDRKMAKNIQGYSIENINKCFYHNFEMLPEKIDYVIDTGECTSIDTLESDDKKVILYRIYISRCKIQSETCVLLQFVKFPTVPTQFEGLKDKLTLGLLQYSNKPTMFVDSECNIFDKNFKALDYLKSHGVTEFNRKLYQIYPTLNNKSQLDEASEQNSILSKFMGYKEYTELQVHRISIDKESYYIISILDQSKEKSA